MSLADLIRRSLASALLLIDSHGRIATCTPQAERLLRISAAEWQHRSFQQLPPDLVRALEPVLSDGAIVENHPVVVSPPERESVILGVTAARIRQDGSNVTVVVLNDHTIIRRVERKMEQLDRLASIGTLSAGMAHEIKNAMVAVKTFVELLLKKNRDAELAEIVPREMRRIDSIVSQMLRFAGPAKPTFAAVHLHEILDRSLRLVQHHLVGRSLRHTAAFNAVADQVWGDAYQLQQAFLNVIFNALDAMGPDGLLTLATQSVASPEGEESQPTHLRVEIRDTGVGIPPENLSRLFEPFFTTKPSGTGLGLAISERIIREHSGTIEVKSEPGQGSTFSVILPILLRRA